MPGRFQGQPGETSQHPQHQSRLPWSRGFQRRFGIDRSQWIILSEIIFPNAQSERAIEMALAYCKVRNLDVFKRPVHIVQVYDASADRMIDAVWPGIAELRMIAMRTEQFAGFGQTEFGDIVEKRLGEALLRFPDWARCTVYRMVAGQRAAFAGPKVYWEEAFVRDAGDGISPNAFWRRRPRGQLEKCAEAAALRRAFPEELGSEYAAEEIDGHKPVRNLSPDTVAHAVRNRLEARPKTSLQGFSRVNRGQALWGDSSGLGTPSVDGRKSPSVEAAANGHLQSLSSLDAQGGR